MTNDWEEFTVQSPDVNREIFVTSRVNGESTGVPVKVTIKKGNISDWINSVFTHWCYCDDVLLYLIPSYGVYEMTMKWPGLKDRAVIDADRHNISALYYKDENDLMGIMLSYPEVFDKCIDMG